MKRSIPVNIAGRRYVLRSDKSERMVQALAADVDRRMSEIVQRGKAIDTQHVAVLVALQIAEELQGQQDRLAAIKKEVRQKGRALLKLLERQAGV